MQKSFKRLLQAAKFAVVGAANTLIDFGVFTVLAQLLSVNVYLAQIIGYSCGMLNSYIFNRSWTFESKGKFWSTALLRFLLLNLAMLGVSTLLLSFLLNRLALPKLIAKAGATLITMCISFVVNKLWVFGKNDT